MKKHRVCIIAEDLSQPVDEGIKHFAYSLIESWADDGEALGISLRSAGEIDSPRTVTIKTNRLLLNAGLRTRIRGFRPQVICYVPSASATPGAFLRSRIIKLMYPAAKVVMVSLQPRDYGRLAGRLAGLVSPDRVFVQSREALAKLEGLGCRAGLLPSGVDTGKFKPVTAEKKAELRAKYGFEKDAFTVLHVGHLTRGRNIELLTRVRQELNARAVFVGSSLRHPDSSEMAAGLRDNGVTVFDGYYKNIEEIYQLSDCYLFPVFSDRACIGVPLSILEAMACNLPVVSVRYGTLPSVFAEGQGLVYADSPEDLINGINGISRTNGCRTREKVLPYSWKKIADYILEQTLNEDKDR